MAEETRGTVLVALAANLGVGVAKGVGGAITGSSALLAEAAHSVADTLNEGLLLLSMSRSSRPADQTHPFGYGKERFFYSLMASIGIFISGAVFSVAEGVYSLLGEGEGDTSTLDFIIIYAILAVALVLEGASLTKALRQVTGEAREAHRGLLQFITKSPDPTVKTVATEDTIAVLGVLVAVAGTVAHQVTGSPVGDAAASIVIGLLLAWVAVLLGRDTKELLIGEAADPVVRLEAFEVLESDPGIRAVKEMLTMQLGPQEILVAARVEFDPEINAQQVQEICTHAEEEMKRQVPSLTQVFIDPSTVSDEDSRENEMRLAQTIQQVRRIQGSSDAIADVLRTRSGRRLRAGVSQAGAHRVTPGSRV